MRAISSLTKCVWFFWKKNDKCWVRFKPNSWLKFSTPTGKKRNMFVFSWKYKWNGRQCRLRSDYLQKYSNLEKHCWQALLFSGTGVWNFGTLTKVVLSGSTGTLTRSILSLGHFANLMLLRDTARHVQQKFTHTLQD